LLQQRYQLLIAYDGTAFCGWQKQEPPIVLDAAGARIKSSLRRLVVGESEATEEKPARYQLRSVQHMVEQALRAVVRQPVMLSGSSRTDSGVHARGQIGAFSCSCEDKSPETKGREGGWPAQRGVDRLLLAVNGRLPQDVRILNITPTHATFNPTMDVTSKSYSYTIHSSQMRPLWDRHFVHYTYQPLDVAAMSAAAAALEGEHDFTSFAATGHGRMSTLRRIFSCKVTSTAIEGLQNRCPGQRIRIDVSGNGFLWNMVRILAGTLLRVGIGRITPAQIPEIIAAKDRRAAGSTLPPTGLCLEQIILKEHGLGNAPAWIDPALPSPAPQTGDEI